MHHPRSLSRRRLARRVAASALLLFAAIAPPRANATTVADVTRRGKLLVLCFPDTSSPFLSRNAAGAYEGVDIGILHSFAARLHVALVVHEVAKFADLLPALARGDGD